MPRMLLLLLVCLSLALPANSEQSSAPLNVQDESAVQQMHQHFSVECFNACWQIIGKGSRSPEETDEMLALSYASLYHWMKRADCKPDNLSVAYWQLSRVHALAGQGDLAVSWGNKCLEVSVNENLQAFYLGYAFEALARGYLEKGDKAAAKTNLGSAQKELEKVTDAESRKQLEADLKIIASNLGEN